METRGRGREARASTDESPPSDTTVTTPGVRPDSSAQDQPSTRSRTRSSRAIRLYHNSRTTRATAADSAARGNTVPLRSIHPDSLTVPLTRSRRASAARRISCLPAGTSSFGSRAITAQPQSAASLPLPPGSSIAVPSSRKRTRSSSRAIPNRAGHHFTNSVQRAHSSSSAALPLIPTAATASFQTFPRPSKRARKGSHSNRQLKIAPSSSAGGGKASGTAQSFRRVDLQMDLPSPQDGSSGRNPAQSPSGVTSDGPHSLGSDRVGASALQGLLRRLGADISDIFPGSSGTSHSRLQQLRTSIADPDNDEHQITALSELCEFLSVGTEETLVSFSVSIFVGPLVNVLRNRGNVENKIYAARALTHMMEALPSAAGTIASQGAAVPLCQNLLSIEYIDLAEQSLSALHKLSIDHPQQIVTANGFQAVLSFIDFFSIGVQRVAAATACNLCRLPRTDALEMVGDVLPTMMKLLDSADQRIRESAVLGFTRLAESFRGTSSKVEALCGEQAILIEKVLRLIVPSYPPALSPQSYASALQLLSTLVRGSARLGIQVLSTESLILKLQSNLVPGSMAHPVDALILADSLLPDLPDVGGSCNQVFRSRRKKSALCSVAYAEADAKRRENLQHDMTPLQFFGRSLFGAVMKFYVSSADSNGRRLVLSIMSKFIAIAPKDVLFEVIKREENHEVYQISNAIRFCSFVSALLRENSSKNETLIGLAMTDSALQKLPSLRRSFIREGVVHEIVRLAAVYDLVQDADKPIGETILSSAIGTPGDVGALGGDGAMDAPPVDPFVQLSDGEYSVTSRGMNSIWTAVAAVQRHWGHHPRGDVLTMSPRLGSSLDVKIPDLQSLHDLVPKAAKSILRTHLGAGPNGTLEEGVLTNSNLEKLTEICGLLRSVSFLRNEQNGVEAVAKLVNLLCTSDRLTVFEVSSSGILEALAFYMTSSDRNLKHSRVLALVECMNKDNGRGAFCSLVELSLGALSCHEKLAVRANEAAAGGAISTVVSSGLRQLSRPLKLRLRKASSCMGGVGLRDYSHHVVHVDPFAEMGSIQEFLWPKVFESEQAATATHHVHGRRRKGIISEDGKGDAKGNGEGSQVATAAEAMDEQAGPPLGDDADARKDMFAMDGNNVGEENSSDEELSSGEEDAIEQETGESDDNGAESADAFGVDQLGNSLPPLELDHESLGRAPGRARRAQAAALFDGSAQGSSASGQGIDVAVNFRSYAAALAANMPRGLDRISFPRVGRNSHRQPSPSLRKDPVSKNHYPSRLAFTMNQKAVPHDCSILRAVIQSSGRDCEIGPRLWSGVHTLVYSKAESLPLVQSRSMNEINSKRTVGAEAGPVRRSQRLQEHREKSRIGPEKKMGCDLYASEVLLSKINIAGAALTVHRNSRLSGLPLSISPIIEVLDQLQWVYEKMNDRLLGRENLLNVTEGLREGRAVDFHSHKLSAKLIRQLSDPLALCGGVIPNWCFCISRDASFLIPFETRRSLFQSTALDVKRALHLLQKRVELSGVTSSNYTSSRGIRESEARISRIQRQKVRLHRNRILESAIKVMSLYGADSTVLEVEYFDEVGTGLGPTLEFYTLASRELQRVDLGLWRGTAVRLPNRSVQLIRADAVSSRRTNSASSKIGTRAVVRRRSPRHSQHAVASEVLQITREDEEKPAFVISTGRGLFPSCLPVLGSESQESSLKTIALFEFVGRLLGKAIVDGRLLDLRFSKTFSKLLLGFCRVLYEKGQALDGTEGSNFGKSSIGASDCPSTVLAELDANDGELVWDLFVSGTSAMSLLEDVDPQLASSLRSILNMVSQGQGELVESLCLPFVLPGDNDYELIKNGSNVIVTGENAEEFVRRVVFHVLFGGVQQQTKALLQGLSEVLDITSLLVFRSEELELLMCGPSFEKWSLNFLVEATRCDHGYSHESPSVMYFLRILSELDQSEQQCFVLFATGSPALPLGGLRSLSPKLTIVRRTPEAGRSADECLPTVMTCTNYFKLPDYSTFDIARKQVLYAVREGQGSFHLS